MYLPAVFNFVLFTTSSVVPSIQITTSSDSIVPFRTCGTDHSPQRIAEAEARFSANLVGGNVSSQAIVIPVYWHVIHKSTDLKDGYIPDSQITASIDVLNQDYATTGVSFTLIKTTRTLDADWFDNAFPAGQTVPVSPQQTAMKKALRIGGANALNVYSVGFTNPPARDLNGLLGYATFPSWYSGNPSDDGVVIRYSTVPGGSAAPLNLGRTLTHEAGHWVGLYHVFQGGCVGDGDFVDDTPPQDDAIFGCPQQPSYSCHTALPDPIRNYMGYVDDGCMDEFTPGQTARLTSQLATFRGA